MLEILAEVEHCLGRLLVEHHWKDVRINYHPPFVDRLWTGYKEYRVFLHCVHPCNIDEALFHPHPWPSAMRIVKGTYEMIVGFGEGESQPPVASRLVLPTGSLYEMTEKNSWHAVAPLGEPAWSIMVTGWSWDRPSPKPSHRLGLLSPERREDMLDFFCSRYPV